MRINIFFCLVPCGGILSPSVYVCVFNLRECHLRLTLGRIPLCSLILVCVSQHRWMNAIGQKKAPPHSLAINRDTHNQVRPTCSIFEQHEPWTEVTEPQPNLWSAWVWCPVILWNSSLCSQENKILSFFQSYLQTRNLCTVCSLCFAALQ